MPNRSLQERLARSLALLLFAFTVYRAVTQSVTHDEAWAFEGLVAGPWRALFRSLPDNHHVLYTLLAKASVSLFGVSTFALRLPALAGAALFLWSALGVARRVGGAGWLGLLTCALLVLDPGLLDHLSAARGYGLGLGFFFYALWQLLEQEQPEERGRRWLLVRAGAALGLSAASNLSYVLPGAGLSLAALAAATGAGWPARLRDWASCLVLPGLGALGLAAGAPLLHLRLGTFYVGTDTLAESAASIAAASFFPRGLSRALPPAAALVSWCGAHAPLFAAAVLGAVALALAAALLKPRLAGVDADTGSALVLAGGAALFTLGLQVCAHALAGVRYPEARMGIWWPPLLYACAVLLARQGSGGRLVRALRALPLALCAVPGLVCALFCLDPTLYATWAFDRSSKRYVEEIIRAHAAAPQRPVSMGVHWLFEPSFNFYRVAYGLGWMEEIVRGAPEKPHDWYVLHQAERARLQSEGLVEVLRDDVAETVLARPRYRVGESESK